MDGVKIDWVGGNCPVQAEGTFDGVPFYFRARGTSVTCDVGDDWDWVGPEYEWPDAGWISEGLGIAYIHEAYRAWRNRDRQPWRSQREQRLDNDRRGTATTLISVSARLERALGEDARVACDWLMDEAGKQLKSKRVPEPAVEPAPGAGDLSADDGSEVVREDP